MEYKSQSLLSTLEAMTESKRKRITSYLAIKYGLPIYHDYLLSDATVLWDRSVAGIYDNNVIGIVNDKLAKFVQSKSKSEHPGDYIEISAANTTTFGDTSAGNVSRALLVGHNNVATTTSVPFDPGLHLLDNGERLNRVWRARQLGGYDDYDVVFDEDILTNLPTDFKSGNIVLLVSSSPTFDSNTEAYPLFSFGTGRKATGINFGTANASTKYFTIGILETSTWIKSYAADNLHDTIGGNIQVRVLKDQAMGVNDMEGIAMSGSTQSPALIPSTNNEMNFQPYIKFNQGGQRNYIVREEYAGFGFQESTVFMVTRHDGSGGTDQAFISYATVDPAT